MSTLRELLSEVPQAPEPHPEGDVFVHTRMVRRSMSLAVDILRAAQVWPDSSLTELDFNLTDEERNIVRAAAWMHDIGKLVTTTLNVGYHISWNNRFVKGGVAQYAYRGRWQALEHERPYRFKQAMRKLKGSLWEPIWHNSTFEAKKDVFFIVRYHMGLGHGDSRFGFGRRLSRRWVTPEGKYKNKRRFKLLFVVICMDRLGRSVPKVVTSACDAVAMFEDGARFVVRQSERQSEPAPDDPVEFLRMLKGKPEQVIRKAFRGKFDREVTPEELGEV